MQPDEMPVMPDDEVVEVETRERVALRLLVAMEGMAEATGVAQGMSQSDDAKNYAAAASDLAKAYAVLAPIEAADDLAESGGAEKP